MTHHERDPTRSVSMYLVTNRLEIAVFFLFFVAVAVVHLVHTLNNVAAFA